jgi:tol-pal system protein YbgF
MRLAGAVAVILLLAGCGTTAPAAVEPSAPSPPASPQPDPRVSEMQILVRELVDRMEVMQSRLNRLEETLVELSSASGPATPRQAAQVSPPVPALSSEGQASVRRYLTASEAAERYKQSMVLYARGRIDDARSGFLQVYESDPSGELADNALYWIGESWYVMGNTAEAIRYWDRVISEFPDQNKAPDAFLKKSLALVRRGDLSLARKTLQDLIERYPYSTAASAASQELERIRY